MDNSIMLKTLEGILKNDSVRMFHIGADSEACFCLKEDGKGGWMTYSVERGQLFAVQYYDTAYDACLGLIKRVSYSPYQTANLQQQFISGVLPSLKYA